MDILINKCTQVFNTEEVRKGDLIRAKYAGWTLPRNGIVSRVTEKQLQILYIPDATNASNYFPILASEVAAGEWSIRWSHDLELIEGELAISSGTDDVDKEL